MADPGPVVVRWLYHQDRVEYREVSEAMCGCDGSLGRLTSGTSVILCLVNSLHQRSQVCTYSHTLLKTTLLKHLCCLQLHRVAPVIPEISGTGHCESAVHDAATGITSVSCYGPRHLLAPGEVCFCTPVCGLSGNGTSVLIRMPDLALSRFEPPQTGRSGCRELYSWPQAFQAVDPQP